MSSLRRSLLSRAFNLLYGPLVLLHEPLGDLFYGPSWKGRRRALLAGLDGAERIIEVGSGEGRLVRRGSALAVHIAGFEPSTQMRRRAWAQSVGLVDARAQELPVPDGTVDVLLVSYPGPWIFDVDTWREFGRVLAVGGQVRILAGGRIGRVDGGVRGRLLSFIYGSGWADVPPLEAADATGIEGDWEWRADAWGAALLWEGRKVSSAAGG